jgi:cyclase
MLEISNFPEWNTGLVKLRKNIYAYLQAKGTMGLSNAGVIIGDKYSIVIDTLTSVPHTQAFLNEIKTISKTDIKYLIITHHHADHCMGNHLLNNAVSICHKKCYEEILRNGEAPNIPVEIPGIDLAGARYILPDITYTNSVNLYFNSEEIRLLHYGPAHSVGDTIVYIPDEGIVFCGDILFFYVTPLGRRASFLGWISALNKIAELDADIFIPGHGPITDRNGLITFCDYLMSLYDQAKKAFNEGLTSSEAIHTISLGEFKKWAEAERIVVNIDQLYREFNGEDLFNIVDPLTFKRNSLEMEKLRKSDWYNN